VCAQPAPLPASSADDSNSKSVQDKWQKVFAFFFPTLFKPIPVRDAKARRGHGRVPVELRKETQLRF